MTSSELPLVLLTLPDGQTVRAQLHARKETPAGWRYQVGVALYRYEESGAVEPAEYVVWVVPGIHAHPIEGVDYASVPTEPLHAPAPIAPDLRWAWTVERRRLSDGRVELVVHTHDCTEAPGGGEELNVDQALTALERTGARACHACDAAASLLPLRSERPDVSDL
ncbi:DUF6233 domain-containing protein [Streptomyces sp. B-S-A8]|uniref:DUF6233 domain-containing protein n=1 Tax=Streptomyces solicavernae TaxID=3043614 RepID=A0ABT6S1B6_9ACTN|nr:DUF6233 domain-containing protein [Streptomyces sp. B-S-A8]MDI3390485.1 DUF6233 domain-containing protein [Streptomyces sp. B-S-A8]